MSPVLITKQDVFKIDCRPVNRSEFDGKSYSVWVYKSPIHVLAKKVIGYTGTLLATRKMSEVSEQEKLNLAMKLGGRLYAQGATQDQANITYDNFETVQGKKVDDEEIDSELMTLIAKFFKIQPTGKTDLTIHDLFISTDFRIDDIRRRLQYLANRDLIEWVSKYDVFKITPKGFEEVESRGSGADATRNVENRYFQVVSLSKKVKEPFAFV